MSWRDEHTAENHDILQNTLSKSVHWYDIIHCCIKILCYFQCLKNAKYDRVALNHF